MKYQIKFPKRSLAKKFENRLKKIPSKNIRNKIKEKILSLADNPRPQGEPKIKPPIKLYGYVAQYRLRIGDYRILYDVDDKKRIVWIYYLRKRNERTY